MAASAVSHLGQDSAQRSPLFLAFALGANTWKLGFTTGAAQRARERRMAAGDSKTLWEEIACAKQRFNLPEETPVIRGDEAGCDGWWRHRFLVSQGVANHGVDAASMAVNRRSRRAKTDRLDVPKWLTMLLRHVAGERQVWRALLTAKRDRPRVSNRMQGL